MITAAGSLCLVAENVSAFVPPSTTGISTTRQHRFCTGGSLSVATSPDEALERVKNQLNKMNQDAANSSDGDSSSDPSYESLYREYAMLPANTLKAELKKLKLPQKGRKPDLAKRLAEYEIQLQTGRATASETPREEEAVKAWKDVENSTSDDATPVKKISSFCGISLSNAGSAALSKASFQQASPIQHRSIPAIVSGESVILHAETGSGKTLAYLLPITEQLWLEHNSNSFDGDEQGYAIIMTPTRELAAQVAGVASVLAPPGYVRLVSHPTNLCNDGQKDRGEEVLGGRMAGRNRDNPRLIVGSAKAIMHSLYGDGKMPASPTTKPEAMNLLRNVRYVVLDEVDRLLNVKKTRGGGPPSKRKTHEKPAAIVSSAVARMTLGRAQIVAASATVGRPLKRELTRVLGLSPQDCPRVIRGSGEENDDPPSHEPGMHMGRAVTIPDIVQNYIVSVDEESTGKLLTSAMFAIKQLNKKNRKQKMLLVLTRGCGINTQTAVGAMKHFRCDPEPVSLLDALQADGTNSLIEKHRQVSGAGGVGEAYFQGKTKKDADNDTDDNNDDDSEGYLLVTGEDTVRGLHLDGLETVLVVGRAHGPDEYTHIAGRTGRAGKPGKVVNVMNSGDARKVGTWDKLLDVEFTNIAIEELEHLN